MFTLLKMLYKLRALIGPPARLFHLLVMGRRAVLITYTALLLMMTESLLMSHFALFCRSIATSLFGSVDRDRSTSGNHK